MTFSDPHIRRYMLLAEKAQAGTAAPLEKLALGLLHVRLRICRELWLKGLEG